MTKYQQLMILVVSLVIGILRGAMAEPTDKDRPSSYSAMRIEALNNAITVSASNSVPIQKEIMLPDGEMKTPLKIKEDLALHGVSIRMEEGKYIDVSKQVENGHSLNLEDQIQVAILNYFHQNFCINQDVNFKVPGEARARIDDIKSELGMRGIFMRVDGDLYVVQSEGNMGTSQ